MTSREPRVMILGNDSVLRGVLLRRFEQEGWEGEEALRAEDVERRAVQFAPHVVVVSLPSEDDVLFLLRRWHILPPLARVRVIVEIHMLAPLKSEELLRAGASAVFLRGHYTPQDIVRRAAQDIKEQS